MLVLFALMDIEKVKRYSLVELALLMIFTVGILIAHLIVKQRSRIELSEPLSLPGSGVCVSLPINNGWRKTPGWSYQEVGNNMLWMGQLRIPGRGEIEVQWKYYFNMGQIDESGYLKKWADRTGVNILRTGETNGTPSMTYGRMYSEESPQVECLVGVVCLDFDRAIELFVKSSGADLLYTEKVFKQVAESFVYKSPQALHDGLTLTESFLDHQLQALKSGGFSKEAFLIKDALNNNLGFYYMRPDFYHDEDQLLEKFQIRKYELRRYDSRGTLWYSPIEKEYRWETKLFMAKRTTPEQIKIVFDPDDGLSVSYNSRKDQEWPLEHMILPELFLHEYARSFLASQFISVVVDVVGSSGQLAPVLLTRISSDQAKITATEDRVSVVHMNYLHSSDSFEELLFDQDGALIGKLEKLPRRKRLIWESASEEQIQDIFEMNLLDDPEQTAGIRLLDTNTDIENSFVVRNTNG